MEVPVTLVESCSAFIWTIPLLGNSHRLWEKATHKTEVRSARKSSKLVQSLLLMIQTTEIYI